MPLIVQKYGGTSVADPDRMRAVAENVALHPAGHQLVRVRSRTDASIRDHPYNPAVTSGAGIDPGDDDDGHSWVKEIWVCFAGSSTGSTTTSASTTCSR